MDEQVAAIATTIGYAIGAYLGWRVFKATCTTSIEAGNSEQMGFVSLRKWIAANVDGARSKRLLIGRMNGRRVKYTLIPGYGTHLVRVRGRLGWITYRSSEIGSSGDERYEDLKLTVLGWSRDRTNRIAAEIESSLNARPQGEVSIYTWMKGRWHQCAGRHERTLDSVGMKAGERGAIVDEIEQFHADKDWYAQRGLAYRRSYLFCGPPGTGKTSLAFALAAHFRVSVYTVNAGSLRGDDDLISAFTSVKERSIMLMEDIDATQRPRTVEGETTPDGTTNVTLSALLNVIDGMLCPAGLLLVMTTNHPDRLDAALRRPGRIDRRVDLGPLDAKSTGELVRMWTGQDTEEELEGGLTGAEIEQVLIALHGRGQLTSAQVAAGIAARAKA